jgi:hypothetical protein
MALNLRALASKYRRWMLAFGIVIVLAILSIPIVQALATQSWSSATVLSCSATDMNLNVTGGASADAGYTWHLREFVNGSLVRDFLQATGPFSYTTSGGGYFFGGTYNQAPPYNFTSHFDIDDGSGTTVSRWELSGTCDSVGSGTVNVVRQIAPPVPVSADGRINNYEALPQVAIYPHDDGLRMYNIGPDGAGTLALEVTADMIAAVPALPAENTLIASNPDGTIAVYRLTTGEFQVNAGPNVEGWIDVTIFSEIYSSAPYYTYRFK